MADSSESRPARPHLVDRLIARLEAELGSNHAEFLAFYDEWRSARSAEAPQLSRKQPLSREAVEAIARAADRWPGPMVSIAVTNLSLLCDMALRSISSEIGYRVPVGHKALPRFPTEEMQVAGIKATNGSAAAGHIVGIYKAMYEAVPTEEGLPRDIVSAVVDTEDELPLDPDAIRAEFNQWWASWDKAGLSGIDKEIAFDAFDAAAHRYKELPAVRSATPLRWIPVSERVPQRGDTVLVWWKSEGVAVADIADRNDDERGFFVGESFWSWSDATHWMPLPSAPSDSSSVFHPYCEKCKKPAPSSGGCQRTDCGIRNKEQP